MTTLKALHGKLYAGNPHVRFDEGEVASATTPRRGSLLYKIGKTARKRVFALIGSLVAVSMTAQADDNDMFTVTTNGTTVTVDKSSSYVAGKTFSRSFPDATSVRKLVFNTLDFTFAPDVASGLPDGVVLNGGIARIKNAGALGAGPLVINSNGQFILSNSGEMDIANKVVFGNADAKVVSAGLVNYPVLHALSATDDTIHPWLGRTSGDSRVCLSLTGEANEALGGIRLSGALKPFELDDGTLRIARSSVSPFFSHVGTADDKSSSQYLVTADNLTIDVSECADIELGLPLDMANATKVTAEVPPENTSFENGETGWLFDEDFRIRNAVNGKVGVNENGTTSKLGIDGTTSYGSHYYVLRCLHRIKSNSTIAIPDMEGDWYVSLSAATRNQYYSYKIELKVRFISSADSSIFYETTLPARSGYHNNFTDFEIGPFDIPAGEYYVQIETTQPDEDTQKYSMLAIDNINVFCRGKVDTNLAKTGAGRTSLSETEASGSTFAVNAGTLAASDSVLDGTTVNVSNGGTFELAPGVSGGEAGLIVSVAAGGTLKLTDVSCRNLVANGSFEADSIASQNGFEKRELSGWTKMDPVESNAGNGGGSGLQRNGSSVSSEHNPWTVAGVKSAYLRQKTRLSQTVTVSASGNYRFSFIRARRDWRASGKTDDETWNDFSLKASIGDQEFNDIPLNKNSFERFSQTVALTAGNNTISFETCGDNGIAGVMCFIDDVRLERIEPLGEINDVEVRLASGSTLRLDYGEEVGIKNLYVDDVEIRGHAGAIRAAGVTVEGDGILNVGGPGLVIILR